MLVTTATITSKGQLTIPKRIRESMNLHEGDQVVVVIEDERIALYPVRRRALLSLQGAFAGLRPFPGREVERDAAMCEAAREALGLPEE
jgi:AbrB family looped-hinge helix DNA binding protein